MKKKRLLVIFVVSFILLSNYSLSYGADDDLRLPIFRTNRVGVTTIFGDIVTQIEI